MLTKNGLFSDIPAELWNDWKWQAKNRVETLEQLKQYITLTSEEEESISSMPNYLPDGHNTLLFIFDGSQQP